MTTDIQPTDTARRRNAEAAWAALVHDASIATDLFTDDELEAYAASLDTEKGGAS